jgi:hypothetical protein
MNNVDYCYECGGEIVGIMCSVCYKTYRSTRNIGSTKKYLQEKICDAKKGGKIDSLFYDKEFIKEVTGDDRLGSAILCTSIYQNYEKIIKNGRVKRKAPRSVIDYHPQFTYLDNEKLRSKKKVRVDIMSISGIKLFVGIGFSDKNEKNLIISSGFTNKNKNKNKNKKRNKKGCKKGCKKGRKKEDVKRR